MQIILLLILIMCNAYFAATEIAFISLNDLKVQKQAGEGNKKAKSVQKMLKDPSKFLATIQIGITLAGFLTSAFASDAFADDLAPVLYSLMPQISLAAWKSLSIIIITIILSFITLVFGELVPKRVAMKYDEKIAYATVGVIRVIYKLTAPFVALLTFSTNVICKLFGVTNQGQETITEEEIKLMIDEGEEKGTIEEEEKELLHNVFDFNDTTVGEIMTHRTDIFAIDQDEEIEAILEKMDEYKYSRIPVYEDNIDNIQGVLFIKDVIKALTQHKNYKVKELMQETYFVPESKMINELFKELQRNKKQIAIVIDEYGGTAGIVTMEDILEELVGNIFDEYDDVEVEYETIDANTYLINGNMTLEDVSELLGITIPEGEYDTLSGYLLEKLGRIPEEEEYPVIEENNVIYKIEEYEDKRIKRVKVCKT